MSVVSFIVIAIAFGISNMLLFHRCSEFSPIRLTTGLLTVLTVTTIHVALFYFGNTIGSLLCLHSPTDSQMYNDVNAYICLGITVAVTTKTIVPYLKREPSLQVFDIHYGIKVLAMGVATGINVLLIGISTGFVEQHTNVHKLIWPLLVSSSILGYLGLMFGRQRITIHPRRWMVVSCLLLLGVAIAVVVNA